MRCPVFHNLFLRSVKKQRAIDRNQIIVSIEIAVFWLILDLCRFDLLFARPLRDLKNGYNLK